MSENQLETYTVLSPLKYNGQLYQKGETVELDAETAEALVSGKNPTAKKGKWQLGDKEVTEEPQRSNEPVAKERVQGETAAGEVANPDGTPNPSTFGNTELNDDEIETV